MDGEEETQKTKGTKRKAESVLARKRKQGGLSLEEEDEEDANEESGGSSGEEEGAATGQEKGVESEDARKKKEDELWASFLHFMANRWGNNGKSDQLYFWGLQNNCRCCLQPCN